MVSLSWYPEIEWFKCATERISWVFWNVEIPKEEIPNSFSVENCNTTVFMLKAAPAFSWATNKEPPQSTQVCYKKSNDENAIRHCSVMDER